MLMATVAMEAMGGMEGPLLEPGSLVLAATVEMEEMADREDKVEMEDMEEMVELEGAKEVMEDKEEMTEELEELQGSKQVENVKNVALDIVPEDQVDRFNDLRTETVDLDEGYEKTI